MRDGEKLRLIAEGIARLPLRIFTVAPHGKAVVTELITSVGLERFVRVDGGLYETEALGTDGIDYRYKLRPAHDGQIE
ncbi:hypothetical protein [Rhizobium leguminosarum]|uniref:hypothetical protein n=1 Tax=Rhizobium leguminosarum TaxID=384 RepID=UPI0013B825E2|nr:hypothetical protein [Rhizobium leguminosarum]NEI60891.1 hypothetical protein [Rhizobium leguminosarum]